MKKFLTLAMVAALAIGASSVVYANVCAFDVVPAATLLFPFVALDYNNPVNGDTTLFAITNVSSEAQIVHIVVWTDYSDHVLDFNIILSGYDVQTINIRDIFVNGQLPSSFTSGPGVVGGSRLASGPVCPASDEWVGPDLPLPNATSTLYDRCNNDTSVNGVPYFPGYPNYPTIPQATLDLFKAKLQWSQTFLKVHADCYTGNAYMISPSDWFQNRSTADATWMYITADVVWTCNRMFPDADAAYWQDAAGNVADPTTGYYSPDGPQAMYDNVLIGDMLWVNDDARFSEAGNAVHIEADVDLTGMPTFYYRYATVNFAQNDHREPLPTAWAMRYIGVGSTAIDTYVRAWKGSTFLSHIQDLYIDPNNGLLAAWDCMAYTLYIWDEDENVCSIPGQTPWSPAPETGCDPNFLPLETQEVKADEFNICFTDGWMLFVWPPSNTPGVTFTFDNYQTWMGVKYAAYGTYSSFMEGAVMANANCFPDQILPNLGINYDYYSAPME